MIEFLQPQTYVHRLLNRFSKKPVATKPSRRLRNLRVEHLEQRALLTAVFAVTDTNELVQFDSGTANAALSIGVISGLQAGEQIQGIDFRPATGELYALGTVDIGATNEGRIYKIDISTAAATQVGTTPFSTTLADSADWGFDFNPTVDRIRIVNDADANLRVHPDTGVLAFTDTDLDFATGDINFGADAAIVGSAYNNNVGGATATTLYSIDFTTSSVVRQGGVEGTPSPNGGALNTVGLLGVSLDTENVGFDIDSHSGRAFASLSVGATTGFYSVNLTTGAATLANTIGDGSFVVRDIAVISQPAASVATVFAVNTSGELVRFQANAPANVTVVGTITGLQSGEVIAGIDFRPSNGQLYALGVQNVTGADIGTIYTINTTTAAATAVASGGASFSTTLTDAVDFGFDFNPVPDRIRIVDSTGVSLRVNPNDGITLNTDTTLAFAAGDPNVGINAQIVGSAYSNSLSSTTSTTLYGIDGNLNTLVRQGSPDSTPISPNLGQLFTVGATGLGVSLSSDDVGFDIRPGTNTALASLEVGGVTGLYTISLTTGLASLVGTIGAGTSDIVAMSVAPETHLEIFLPDGGNTVTASIVGGNFVVRDGTMTDLITPVPLLNIGSITSLRIFGGDGADSVVLDSSLAGVFPGRLIIYGNAGTDSLDATNVDFGVTFIGGTENDTINGGSGNDSFDGGDGDDLLYGNGGGDVLNGDNGRDSILGVTGNDTITGGTGIDFLNGGAQADSIVGGDGDDVLEGGSGIDTLVGGAGSNSLRSDVAADVVIVNDTSISLSGSSLFSTGTDVLRGTPTLILSITGSVGGTVNVSTYAGVAIILGSIGNDSITGGLGADFIVSGAGNDVVVGGDGNDTIRGLAGNDTISAGLGNDSVDAGIGLDSVTGGDGNDTLLGGDSADFIAGEVGNDSILGGAGADVLRGGDGNDSIFGEAGNDTLNGGADNDSLDGGDGQDGLSGWTGNDILIGGINPDTLIGGDGNDVLRGNSGNDIALGGDGDDSINGDANSDTVAGNAGADVIIDAAIEIDEGFVFTADWIDDV